MSLRNLAFTLAFSLVAGVCAPVFAQTQTLADVARQEEARRKAISRPTKVMTNKDLGSVPASSVPPPSATKALQAPSAAGDKGEAAKDDGDGKSGGPAAEPKGQAYWSGRMKELQTQSERDQTLVDALQSRVNALLTDFVSRSDPAQRAAIERDRQKALGELEVLKQNLQKDKKAVTDLQEEARRTGVPAGWLR